MGIETLWPAVLERVRESEEGGEMLAALLADARPASLTDDELVLEYPQSASFSKRKTLDLRTTASGSAEALKTRGGPAGSPSALELRYGERPGGRGGEGPRGSTRDAPRIKREFDAEEVVEGQPDAEARSEPDAEIRASRVAAQPRKRAELR